MCRNGSSGYAPGCVSASEKNMLKVLEIVELGAKICVYPA